MSDSTGGVVSGFQFISYKIDDFTFSMEKDFSILSLRDRIQDSAWKLCISIRTPFFIEERSQYLAGVKCTLILQPDDENEEYHPVKLEAVISGLFATKNEFSPEAEKQLVKTQMPAILMPYLRAAITSFMANAGFGSIMLPLINMNKLAEDMLMDQDVNVVTKKTMNHIGHNL